MISYHEALDAAFATEADDVMLKSEIPQASDPAWTRFVSEMISAKVSTVGKSNEVGMFEMKPRRLADLGYATNLIRGKSPSSKRTIYFADFVAPITELKFLSSPSTQYRVFSHSMKNYARRIEQSEIEKPVDMTLSGALAILHRAGPKGLESWQNGKRFSDTVAAHERAEGIF